MGRVASTSEHLTASRFCWGHKMRQTILVVDDERIVADTIVAVLNQNEFVALACYTVAEAIAVVRGIRPDLVVLDVLLPGAERLEHALTIRDECGCKVLLISGQPITGEWLDELRGRDIKPFEVLAK